MITKPTILLSILVAGTLGFGKLANAQSAPPPGSCALPGGKWCWPTVADSFGQPCQCPSPDGPIWGVIK